MKLRLMICAMAAGTALFATDVTSYTYGVLAVSDTTSSNTVVGVPWRQVSESASATDITLSNLVSTTTLAAGDIVYLYESGTWKGYTLSATKVWEPMTTINGDEVVSPGSADAKELSRGTGLIVQRASNTDPIYLCGRYDSTPPSATPVGAGATVLIANPTTTAKTIGDDVGSNGDEIRIPLDGGGLKVYTKKDDAWGTVVETTTPVTRGGKTINKKTQTWTTGGCELAPGMGAWYVNGSTEAAASIAW